MNTRMRRGREAKGVRALARDAQAPWLTLEGSEGTSPKDGTAPLAAKPGRRGVGHEISQPNNKRRVGQ